MKAKLSVVIAFTLLATVAAQAQTKTTEALHKQHSDATVLFFYNNTLRMINQTGDKDFDALIKDVEKMKMLIIPKDASFNTAQYKKLVSDYKGEAFEEIMSGRYNGKNLDVFLKDTNGKTEGMVLTLNDSSSLYVFDIVGKLALDKLPTFLKTINASSDVTSKIKDFAKKD